MAQGIKEAFKSLLLPVPVEQEDYCLEEFRAALTESGVAPQDHAVWVDYQIRAWSETGTPSEEFKEAIQVAIRFPGERFSENIADCYFNLHDSLQTDFLLSHTQARAYLSHSRLIYTLADAEWMSSAQIANLVGTRDTRVGVSRQSIVKILTKLRIKPRITEDQVRECFYRDQNLEISVMADADLDAAASLVGATASSLGVQIDFGAKLLDLCPDGNLQHHPPYLQILHYQSTIAELYDHRLTDLYEFNPRGTPVGWLVDQYPGALTGASNPFLNNAKSVEALTIGWARSKASNFRSALALFELLAEMEELGFSARKELAQWVRLWIHRVMQLARPLENLIPEDLDQSALERFLENIAGSESGTSGILEQRVVDALSIQLYQRSNDWVCRGAKDPVNATNMSKRKLGDIDFQRVSTKQVEAFEAHAGTLTAPYLNNHMEVLWRVLDARIKEWETYSEETGWVVKIIFVAHAFAVDEPEEIEREGVTIRISFCNYTDLIEEVRVHGGLGDAVRSFVLQPINEKRTPNHARERFIQLSQ